MSVSIKTGVHRKSLRILMQIRANALTQRGGDTVLIEKMTEGLRRLGHEVVWDFEMQLDWTNFDIAHFVNFATPEITEKSARKAKAANLPFVVTTLYEDWPFFFSPMVENFLFLEEYVKGGQQRSQYQSLYERRTRVAPSQPQDNSYTAFHADALIASGQAELETLKRDYPHTEAIVVNHFGCEVAKVDADPELFRAYSKLDEFILCVGRLEWRKNQLMLLKAMEDSNLPIVFLAGSFTYQPEYEALCRQFQRAGKNYFFPRLEPEMLASAFAASKVHALPSWFELPGLVSIEAAHYGTQVVASEYGTIKDYLGEDAFYCTPDSPESIRKAIEAAWAAPRTSKLKERVKRFTWESSVSELIEIYKSVLAKKGIVVAEEKPSMNQSDFSDLKRLDAAMKTIVGASGEVSRAKDTVSLIPVKLASDKLEPSSEESAEALCSDGDRLAREGKNQEASQKFQQAIGLTKELARPYRGLAVLALNEKRFVEAETLFEKALQVDKDDLKSELGIALVQAQSGNKKAALGSYEKVLLKHPNNILGVKQYLQLCYEVDQYDGLERVLRAYLVTDWGNHDMRFCLAGCQFKQGKFSESREILKEIIAENSNHEASRELLTEVEKFAEPFSKTNSEGAVESDFSAKVREVEELLRARKFKEVEEGARKLIEANPSSSSLPLLEIVLSEALICLGRGTEAKPILENNRDDAEYGYRATGSLGVFWGSENNWEKAAQLFRVAIALNPSHDVSLAGLGICSLLAGKKEDAWEFFSRAHASNPENLRALTGLIEVAYPLKRLEALEQALLRYLEFVPANLSILYAHAGCAYAQGKTEVAIKQLEKICLFDPTHALANELLAKIQSEGYELASAS